jgi:tRNA threonylcarbamoyladenosine biosynthesis protein TsaE
MTIYRTGRINPLQVKNYKLKVTKSEAETIKLGEELIENYKDFLNSKPLVILLSGELGAGKTHLTKGIAKALNINQIIKSPTYTYVNEYLTPYPLLKERVATSLSGRVRLYHFDAWRVQSKEDLNSLGFYDWFKARNVIVIEWPSVVMNLDEHFFEKLNYLFIDFINLSSTSREIRIYEQ